MAEELEELRHMLSIAHARLEVLERQVADRDREIQALRAKGELQQFEIKRLRKALTTDTSNVA